MCKNLVEKGQLDRPLLIYNRTKKRTDELAAKLGDKVEAVFSVADGVSRADIIFTCLSSEAAFTENYEAILKSVNVRGKLFVDCATVGPETSDGIASMVTGAGAEFVASPVWGSPAMAEASETVFAVAGPKASIDKVRPYTKGVMGRAEIVLADMPCGAAVKLKIVCNSFVLNAASQLAEALTLGELSGLGTAPVGQFVELLLGGPYSQYSARMLEGTYWKQAPLGSVDNVLKDAGLMLKLARSVGMELRNVDTAKSYLEDVKAYAGGDGEKCDGAGVYGAVRMRAGLKFENDV
jgi:3-hydroxyisobutyrate dehydrogenase-like beta-hydroxyacid dehydrogenase